MIYKRLRIRIPSSIHPWNTLPVLCFLLSKQLSVHRKYFLHFCNNFVSLITLLWDVIWKAIVKCMYIHNLFYWHAWGQLHRIKEDWTDRISHCRNASGMIFISVLSFYYTILMGTAASLASLCLRSSFCRLVFPCNCF